MSDVVRCALPFLGLTTFLGIHVGRGENSDHTYLEAHTGPRGCNHVAPISQMQPWAARFVPETHVRGSGGMRVVVQNPFPDLERVCISGHHGRSRFVAYCTREPAHTRTRSTRSLRTVLPLTPPSPIRISKGCLLTPPAIRTRRRIARASSQASCTERCTRQPSPTTQPTPS